jgi:mannitol/fructose-specific phosphotransferase system IIA component
MSDTSGGAPFLDVVSGEGCTSKRDVILAIGDVLLAASAVTPAYVEGMFRKEEQAATIVMPEVALPHGTSDVRGAVLRNALVVVSLPQGIEWGPGPPVRLAIGFAGIGNEAHLRLMSAVARVLSDGPLVTRLKAATDVAQVRQLLESTALVTG